MKEKHEAITKAISSIEEYTDEYGYTRLETATISGHDTDEVARLYQTKFIDELTVYSTITQAISENVNTRAINNTKELKDDDKKEIVDKVFEILESVPKKYKFLFPLPKKNGASINETITNGIRLVTFNKEKTEELNREDDPRKKYESTFEQMLGSKQHIKEDETYLEVEASGWVDKFALTVHVVRNPVSDPLFIYKTFVAYLMIKELLVEQVNFGPKGISPNYNYLIYEAKPLKYYTAKSETTEDWNFINDKLLYTDRLKMEKEALVKIYGNIKRKKDFSIIDQSRSSLLVALYWYYEASKSEQSHVKSVFLTTCLDALFPEATSKEDKAERISHTNSIDNISRAKIYEFVIDLYSLRNKIVHGQETISKLYDPTYKQQRIITAAEFYVKRFIMSNLTRYISTYDTYMR